MTQAAYDLNMKTKSYGQYRAPRVRVVRGRSRLDKLRQTVAALRSVLVAALILGLVVSLLYSQAIITELSGEIESTRQELTQEQSTYDYLSGRMDDITSTTNIQEIAEGKLGLVKADASQITYITMEDQSRIVRNESDLSRLLSGVKTAALSLIGNFNP
ncbi:hypothetical protein [uncultured Gemmiger sp.]|uniref:hypothetical protein n=1 Tax=uncultured Gemmiger sp. TaxID=1623490 RepID=UPI0025DA8873|nr:hypothetical protein [uncultured Gemmiger sp.]